MNLTKSYSTAKLLLFLRTCTTRSREFANQLIPLAQMTEHLMPLLFIFPITTRLNCGNPLHIVRPKVTLVIWRELEIIQVAG